MLSGKLHQADTVAVALLTLCTYHCILLLTILLLTSYLTVPSTCELVGSWLRESCLMWVIKTLPEMAWALTYRTAAFMPKICHPVLRFNEE